MVQKFVKFPRFLAFFVGLFLGYTIFMRDSVAAIGVGSGGPIGPSLATFISGGVPPTFFLNFVSLSNTTNIGSSDEVTRLMKKTLQNFGSILSILF